MRRVRAELERITPLCSRFPAGPVFAVTSAGGRGDETELAVLPMDE